MSSVLQISHREHVHFLMRQISKAQQRNAFADLHFICSDGKVVHVHAGILGCLSHVIRQCMTTRVPFANLARGLSGHIEIFETEQAFDQMISLPDVSSAEFHNVIALLYNGQVMIDHTQEQSESILRVLHMLRIPIESDNLVIQVQYGNKPDLDPLNEREESDSSSSLNNGNDFRDTSWYPSGFHETDEDERAPLSNFGHDGASNNNNNNVSDNNTKKQRRSCSKCGKTYLKCVARHLVRHEAKCLGWITCTSCGIDILGEEMKQHQEDYHGIVGYDTVPKAPKRPSNGAGDYFPCEICGRKIHRIWVKRHRNEKHSEYAQFTEEEYQEIMEKRVKIDDQREMEEREPFHETDRRLVEQEPENQEQEGHEDVEEDVEGGKLLNCLRCEFQTPLLSKLKVHVFGHFRNHIKDQYLPKGSSPNEDCPFCHYKASLAGNLLAHIGLTHRKIEEFLNLEEVTLLFPRPPSRPKLGPKLLPHDLKELSDSEAPQAAVPSRRWSMACYICDKTIYHSNLKNHFCEHFEVQIRQELERTQPNTLVCSFCHWRAPNGSALVTHVGRRHNMIMDYLDPMTRAKIIVFDDAWELENFGPDKERLSYVCDKCHGVFGTHLELCRHLTMTNCEPMVMTEIPKLNAQI